MLGTVAASAGTVATSAARRSENQNGEDYGLNRQDMLGEGVVLSAWSSTTNPPLEQ